MLTLRDLNRALLSRQLLLERHRMGVEQAVEQVAGLQAQLVAPPHVGLWSRIEAFEREQLVQALGERRVVRATMMRMTLQVVTAGDYLRLRRPLQPGLTRIANGFNGKRLQGMDPEPALRAAREFFKAEPCSYAQLRELMAELEPERDPAALGNLARATLEVVQTPGGALGMTGTAPYADAESWLGAPLEDGTVAELIRRYLRAFGPATPADAGLWSGLTGMRDEFEKLRPQLVTYEDEQGRELFDLPDAPLPGGETPSPVRFLPEFDNAGLAHKDRGRFIAEEHRKKVFLPAGRVRAVFLVDGFAAGTWTLEKKGTKAAAIAIEPFGRLPKPARSEVDAEAERLLRFFDAA